MINVIYSTPRVEGHLLSMDTLNRNNRRFDELFAREKKNATTHLDIVAKKNGQDFDLSFGTSPKLPYVLFVSGVKALYIELELEGI